MKKNVYSILLSDEIIRQIDKIAYANATSRSNMINRILAQFLSFETPEQRTKNVYECIAAYFEHADTFQKLAQQSVNVLTLNSALPFKYNPTVSYRIKVYKLYDDIVGEIKIHFRTQNKELIRHLDEFYTIWAEIEKTNAQTQLGGIVSVTEDGKLTKFLVVNEAEAADIRLGESIAGYIEMTNCALKTFINDPDNGKMQTMLDKIYKNYFHD